MGCRRERTVRLLCKGGWRLRLYDAHVMPYNSVEDAVSGTSECSCQVIAMRVYDATWLGYHTLKMGDALRCDKSPAEVLGSLVLHTLMVDIRPCQRFPAAACMSRWRPASALCRPR